MLRSKTTYDLPTGPTSHVVREEQIEYGFICKARAQAETALMAELILLLTNRARGREMSGLSAYE